MPEHIALIGPPGTGLARFHTKLADNNHKLEPVHLNTNNITDCLNNLAYNKDEQDPSPHTTALTLAASYSRDYHTKIKPRLQDGDHILTDDSYHTLLAYLNNKVPTSWLRKINRNNPTPDLTIVLDTSDPFNDHDHAYPDPDLEALRKAYSTLATEERTTLINVDDPDDVVLSRLEETIEEHFNSHR